MASSQVKEEVQLPVLDLNNASAQTAKELVYAVSRWGFVFIKNNHDEIPAKDIEDMFALSKLFFNSPNDVKASCSVNSGSSGKNSGWFSMNSETLDPEKQRRGDFKEAFNMNEFRNGKAQQPLPPPLLENEARIDHFVNECHALCLRIMELFAIGLNIDASAGGKNWFSRYHDPQRGPSGSVFRLLYYPSLSSSPDYDQETDIRAGAHSDYGTITLLFQRPGQPGLEILASNRGDAVEKWHSVPVNPTNEAHTPILVNVGDLLEHWTNGLLKSAVHRVIFPKDGKGEDRYSIAYFCHPLDSAKLEAVPSEMVEDKVRKCENGMFGDGKVMTAKEHLESRLAATYASKLQETK